MSDSAPPLRGACQAGGVGRDESDVFGCAWSRSRTDRADAQGTPPSATEILRAAGAPLPLPPSRGRSAAASSPVSRVRFYSLTSDKEGSALRAVQFTRGETVLGAEVRDGVGPPLVLLPGVMADAATWRPVVEHIALPNPVLVLDRRGRGASGPLGPGYSVRTEVDDLRHVLGNLGDLGLPGVGTHLFGWSYGGLIALEAAVGRADLRSLTLYEPVARPFAPEALEPLREAVGRNDLDRAVELVNTVVSGFSDGYVAELRRSPVWNVLRSLAEPLADELGAIDGHRPAFDAYAELDVPVTLLLGADNEGRPPYGTAFARFERALPRARVVRIEGEGHLAHASAPRLLAEHITDAVTAH
ncbi:alpha/beta fold hydrolase [Actinomadura luteofluorescens]|uniref:alpha/beta fold hydrolase n=1 Tax=Actinomadura luteofluorescens TaxID=46163 RepID=UPI003476E3B0